MKENLILIAVTLINICLISYMILMIRNSRTYFWPKTEGNIIKSEIDVDEEGIYSASVLYEYYVASIKYESDRVAFAMYGSSNRKMSDKVVGKYPIGSKVKVSYNHKNHSNSILEPGFRVHQFILLFTLIFCFYIWVPFGWLTWTWLLNL